MRHGISVPTFGPFADVDVLVDLAVTAEAAGWDGFFLWDHIRWPWVDELIDPWIALTAIAAATDRIRIGPLVTPLPRRRPHKVARETVALDRFSGGRLVLGVGAGEFVEEFDAFGEATDGRVRAAQLDEALTVVTGLWSGESFAHEGEHYRVAPTVFRPGPIQRPRIPIWVGGRWPRSGPIERALRWDGYFPLLPDLRLPEPADVAAMAERLGIGGEGIADRPGFDLVVISGGRPTEPFARAGATWCLDGPDPEDTDVERSRAEIHAGPRH